MNTLTRLLVALLFAVGAGFVAWRLLVPDAPPLARVVQEAPERIRRVLAPPTEVPASGAESAAPAIEHPVETDPYASLPTLETSDPEFLGELGTLAPADVLARHLESQSLIRRLVVAIDNLPGGRLPMKQRPVKAVGGAFAVEGEDDTLEIAPANYARYEPVIAVAEQVDARALASLYRRYYPLFQQAYQELGYPDAYFNDRLVAVIDHLLDSAPVTGPLRLARPNVLYRFADPALEARSPGQKILLRMGPANAERVKAVLRNWRAAIVAAAD